MSMNYKKIENLNLKNVLDVGANTGEFTKYIKTLYPNSNCFMVEANELCEQFIFELNVPYEIVALSNNNGSANMYFERKNPIATGASLYKENTSIYSDENCILREVKTKRLDDCNYFNNEPIDLIKLDVQGSELDIINGGINVIKNCRYILTETSIIEFNIGAPLADKIFEKLYELNFAAIAITEIHNFTNNIVIQIDFLFKNLSL